MVADPLPFHTVRLKLAAPWYHVQTTYLVHFIQLPLLTLLQLAPGLSTCRGQSEVGEGRVRWEEGRVRWGRAE